MTYIVRDYDPNDPQDAERIADMFNDFTSAWPGGFLRGTDSAAHVRDRKARMRRLAILVAADADTGELVGYCDLEAAPGQHDTSYVDLLGARLQVHGKGVGKLLLREIIRRVVALGYKEVTLHTWAGNTKAVPLYKKTGFQWVPDSNVYMRNFIPSVLAMPVARDFFADRDWYELQQRDLAVAPDDVTWKGMKVFPYHFRSGDDFLHLTFHADSGGLTAIETPTYSLSCSIPVQEAPAGQNYPIVWEITQHDDKPLEVVLLTETDAGLEVNVQERFVVERETTLARELRVSPTAIPRRRGEKPYRVRTTLLVDGQPIVLDTGVKVVRPVEIQYRGQGVFVGREEKITVRMRNRLDRDLEGTLALEPHPALNCGQPQQPFTLPAKSWTQCEYALTATEPGVHSTQLRYEAGEIQGGRSLAFRAFAGCEVWASIDEIDEETAILEMPDSRVEVSLRGGWTGIFRGMEGRHVGQLAAELGPPFGHSWMNPPLYTARVEQTTQGTKLILSMPWEQSPGVVLERAVSFVNSDLLRVEHRVVNTTGQAQPVQLRMGAPNHLNGYLVLQTMHGLIREPLRSWGEYPMGMSDTLAQGTRLAESWAAAEEDNYVGGFLWQGEPEQDVEWGRLPNLTYDLGEVAPHSARSVPPIYVVAAAGGNWEMVRNWWRRLVQPSGVIEPAKPEPHRVLEIVAEPAPALLRQDHEVVNIKLLNRRGAALSGSLALSGDGFHAETAKFALGGIDRDHPLVTEVPIYAPETPSAGFLRAEIDNGCLTETRPLPVVRLSAGDEISVMQPEAGHVVIDNGYLMLRFALDFCGALYALETNGVNHLLSPYPQPRPFHYMNPWYGGIHLFNNWMGDPTLPREKFSGEPIEREGERGWRWQGVRIGSDLEHKDHCWQRVELEYLTLPGSNVVALIARRINRTEARHSPYGGVGVWAQPGGTRENTLLHWERAGERRQRRRSAFSAEGESGRWIGVENPATGDTLLLVSPDLRDNTCWEDLGAEGMHLQAKGQIEMGPHESQERVFWLILCQNIGHAEAYGAAFSQARRLP